VFCKALSDELQRIFNQSNDCRLPSELQLVAVKQFTIEIATAKRIMAAAGHRYRLTRLLKTMKKAAKPQIANRHHTIKFRDMVYKHNPTHMQVHSSEQLNAARVLIGKTPFLDMNFKNAVSPWIPTPCSRRTRYRCAH
jgi:hypothetical protein